MTKYLVIRQFNEPDSAGGAQHNPGEVAELDPVKVFDLDELIQQGVVSLVIEPPTETPIEPPSYDGTTRKFKADKTTTPPADPPVQEDKVNG